MGSRKAFLALALACGAAGCSNGGGGGSGGPNAALFGGPLMFLGAQMHIYGTRNLQLADFNNDGLPDLVYEAFPDLYNDFPTLYDSPGSNTEIFGAPIVPGTGYNSVIADFDGDGNQDIVSVVQFDADIRGSVTHDATLMLGNGDNTFAAPLLLGLTEESIPFTDAVAADINGDDMEDLLSLGYGSGEIFPLLNQGAGNFEAGTPVHAGTTEGALSGTDLNQDGFDDIVFFSFDGVEAALSVGDGTFGPLQGVIDEPNVLPQPADLNDDGIADIVGMTNSDGIITFLGHGDGTFAAALPSATTPVLVGGQVLAIGDFDDDGVPDLVVTGGESGQPSENPRLCVALGQGDGTFAPDLRIIDAITSNRIITMDADRDGNLDVLIAVSLGNGNQLFSAFLRPYFGNGDGTFREESPASISVDPSAQMFTAIPSPGVRTTRPLDIDSDGNLDLMVSNSQAHDLSMFLGNGDGTFAPEQHIPLNGQTVRQTSDLDVDGDVDFFGQLGAQIFTILKNYGAGNLQTLPVVQISGARALGAFDLDIDGIPDLVYRLDNGDIQVNYGLGNMQFEPVVVIANIGDELFQAIVDTTGDGYPDIVSQLQDVDQTDFFFVRPGGTGRVFGPAVVSEVVRPAENSGVVGGDFYEIADFNNDGRTDIVRLLSPIENSQELTIISLLRAESDGTFVYAQDVYAPWIGVDTASVDLDLDGDLDLVVGLVTFTDLLVQPPQARLRVFPYLTNSSGLFEPAAGIQTIIGDLFTDSDMEITDITGEGIPDALVYSEIAGLAVAVGQGDGTFSQPFYFQTGGGTRPTIGDFDNDGDKDFASIVLGGGAIELLENQFVNE